MDEKRFDTLTRRLGQATGRRQVLRHLGGGLLGVLVGAVVRGRAAEAAPKRRGSGERCGPGRGNQCAEGLSCLNTNPGGVGTCGGGCGSGLEYCPLDGQCFDPINDGCCTDGDCFGAICVGGSCLEGCDLVATPCTTPADCTAFPGLTCRDGTCTDPLRC